MILMTTYKVKPFLNAEETKKLLEVFASEGPGTRRTRRIMWLPMAVIHTHDPDVAGGYRNIQNYTEWVEYDTKVMLTVEQAVPLIMESLA